MSNKDPLVQKIAQLIDASASDSKHASIFAALEKINHRLDKLEAAQAKPAPSSNVHLSHPSLDKFAIAEAVADAVFAAKSDQKTCTFEPNGRPCDHCSMCSARGY